jgi:hypothetical protein
MATDQRPPAITKEEISAKLAHLAAECQRVSSRGVLLVAEGALRWLTGMRHQVGDIAPGQPSPVSALVEAAGGRASVTFVAAPWELPRLADRIPEVFAGIDGVEVSVSGAMPRVPDGVIAPADPSYGELAGRIVRPLVGGLDGNQYAKLAWLAGEAAAALAESAQRLAVGMDGEAVRGEVARSLAEHRLDHNLILVALAGQERHLHPLPDARYRAERDGWAKLVVGARYAELIVSATVQVKLGRAPSPEARGAYAALQRAAVEYADCYRAGAVEGEIYAELGRRFKRVAEETGTAAIAESAYLHHPGGPCSPLGNRDYLLAAGGTRTMLPWTQFAINPVEALADTKVELQGVVMPEGAPLVLDCSARVPKGSMSFSQVTAAAGTRAMVADIIRR